MKNDRRLKDGAGSVSGPFRTVVCLGWTALSPLLSQAQITASSSLMPDHIRGPGIVAAEGERAGLWRGRAVLGHESGDAGHGEVGFETSDLRQFEKTVRRRLEMDVASSVAAAGGFNDLVGWLGGPESADNSFGPGSEGREWVQQPSREGLGGLIPSLSQGAVPRAASAAHSNPLEVVMGSHVLLPSTANQLVMLSVRNVSGVLQQFQGLNLNMQIGDGGPLSEGGAGTLDGPNIQSVDLTTGTIFAANNTGTQDAGGIPQSHSWTVTTATGNVSLAVGAEAVFAQVRIDTTGITSGTYAFILRIDVPAAGLYSGSAFVGLIGEDVTINAIDGELVVPEPREIAIWTALGLCVVVGVRRRRSFASSSRAASTSTAA